MFFKLVILSSREFHSLGARNEKLRLPKLVFTLGSTNFDALDLVLYLCVGFISKEARGVGVDPLSSLYTMVSIRTMTISEKGICFNVLNNGKDGDILSALTRSRTPRFWANKSRFSCSESQFPHTEQQYSIAGRAIEL